MLASMKQKLQDMASGLKTEVTKATNRKFMDACTAGCAIVANADGSVSSEEKQKMMGFMRTSDVLSVFDMNEVIERFNAHCAKYEFDAGIGEAEALKVVAQLKSKPDEARLLVRACCVIAGADGNFEASERQAITRMCQELGLDASEFLPGKTL